MKLNTTFSTTKNLSLMPFAVLVGVLVAGCSGNEADFSYETASGQGLTGSPSQTDSPGGRATSDENNLPGSQSGALPEPVEGLTLDYSPTKTFTLRWQGGDGAQHYNIKENIDGQSGYSTIVEGVSTHATHATLDLSVINRVSASYLIESCNSVGCTDSSGVSVDVDGLNKVVGIIGPAGSAKAVSFGKSVALNENGQIMVVGSDATADIYTKTAGSDWGLAQSLSSADLVGVDDHEKSFGAAVDISAAGEVVVVASPADSAVHIFSRSKSGHWVHSDTLSVDEERFGQKISLSNDGIVLAVNANHAVDNDNSGSAYVFTRDANGQNWSQAAKLEDPQMGSQDDYGQSISISGDGRVVAVASPKAKNRGAATGTVTVFQSDQGTVGWKIVDRVVSQNRNIVYLGSDDLALNDDGTVMAIGSAASYGSSGAVLVYASASDGGSYARQGGVLRVHSSTRSNLFGFSLSLDGNGQRLAIASIYESNLASGINGDRDAGYLQGSGAVFIFESQAGDWSEKYYIKAIKPEALSQFGQALSLSGDGGSLAVGVPSSSVGISGVNRGFVDTRSASSNSSGAVYLY